MKATCEISLYPLNEQYKETIIDFIQKVKTNKKITVETNGLSTQLFGDYQEIMTVLTNEMKTVFENNKAVFIMKIAQGELKKEDLPEILR